MSLLHLARRLLSASALIMVSAIAVSVMTHDAWLMAGHIAGIISAVVAAVGVLAIVVGGLRGMGQRRPPRVPAEAALAPYERGLTGLEAVADPARPSGADAPPDP